MIRFITQVLAIVVGTSASFGQSPTFIDSDGKPAKKVSFYRSFVAQPQMGGGMMGGGMGMGGGDMEYGRMGDIGDMMGGMGAMDNAPPPKVIAFFNGEPLQSMKGGYADQWQTGEDGTLNDSARAFRLFFTSEAPPRHRFPAIAESPSGFAFIPKGTQATDPIKLRSLHRFSVVAPAGLDASEFQVLACWRNGFAYPSLDFYLKDNPEHVDNVGKQFDTGDWRFKPQFMWFKSGELETELSIPPGEVRITVIPKSAFEQDNTSAVSLERLQELLIAGGPSQLVIFTGKQAKRQVTFEPSAKLIVELPKSTPSGLPNWGDQVPTRYRLGTAAQSGLGNGLNLSDLSPMPAPQDLADGSSFAHFLNASRSERTVFQPYRLPTKQTSESLQFDGLRPGWYVLQRSISGGPWKSDVSFKGFAVNKGVFTTRVEEGASKLKDAAIRFVISTDDKITMKVPDATGSGNPRTPDWETAPVDADRLKQIRLLRSDIEDTIKRLLTHRNSLVQMEAELSGQSNRPDSSDPFGGASDDPFSGSDPFGGPSRPALPQESGGIF